MTATATTPYSRATHRVTFRAAEQELDAIGALAAAMETTTSGVIRAGIARLYADMASNGAVTHQ